MVDDASGSSIPRTAAAIWTSSCDFAASLLIEGDSCLTRLSNRVKLRHCSIDDSDCSALVSMLWFDAARCTPTAVWYFCLVRMQQDS